MDNTFEEKKREYNKMPQEVEYSRGGGGSPAGFFSVKTNVYSRQCYSDPNNPGKMICKETNNSKAFDPFNKEKNYQKSNENVYTKDYSNSHTHKEETNNQSMYDMISGKLKGLFSSRYDAEGNPITNNRTYENYNINEYRNENKLPFQNMNFQSFTPGQKSKSEEYFDKDPFVEDIEKMFKDMHNSFFRGGLFFDDDDEELGQDFFAGFTNNNFPHNHPQHFKENFDKHQDSSTQSPPEIKYKDTKIYDV